MSRCANKRSSRVTFNCQDRWHGDRRLKETVLMQARNLVDGKLPVFVFPSAITFYADDQSSHKQILTLYNPYDFPVTFRVLCTAPRKYVVVDPEGTIKSRCCIDIVIRHNAVSSSSLGMVDKFRIHMQEHGHKQVLGKRDVTATLVATTPDSTGSPTAEAEQFEQLPVNTIPMIHSQQYALSAGRGRLATGPNIVVILTAIACIIALMLPTEGESNAQLPQYLHLSINQKMITAYILGLVTMVIFRP